MVREQSENGESILWPLSQPDPLGCTLHFMVKINTKGYRERLKFALLEDKWGIEKDTSGRLRKVEKNIEKDRYYFSWRIE